MKKYITEVRKVIPSKACEKIIQYFDNDYIHAATIGGLDKDIRNCVSRTLLKPKSFGQRIISNYVQSIFYQIANTYSNQHGNFTVNKISQLDLLKYESNKYKAGYDFHHDFGESVTERHISISVNLNNSFKGGEFVFDTRDGNFEQYVQNTGDAIVFPSNFMFPHKVNKITEGTRYALIGWMI